MLVIRLSALGDVAMTIPVIYSLAVSYPALRIDVVTRPFFSRLFINRPSNVNVIDVDFKKDYKGFAGTVRLLRMLSSLRPDCVADLHNVSRSWVIDAFFRLRGVKLAMVDKMRGKRKRMFETGEPQPSFIDRYAKVFERLGYPVTPSFKSLFADHSPKLSFAPIHPAVGIAPFARYFNKIYPSVRMREVIDCLTKEGYHVYLFGGRGAEADELHKWAEGNPSVTALAGHYPLEDEIALMGAMDVMVSMDSSNQHMASLAGTKVVSIWGSTTPACGFSPYGQPAERSVCLGLSCQPCSVGGSPECPKGHFDCMMKLSPMTIVDRIKQVVTLKTGIG
ncbi:MAG: glycosyltransferase family 9 protein [Bacteroides sp.]|nr:glycosyltransferase family 9 protein [Bacteroides sp.]